MKSLVTRDIFNVHQVFPENSLALGLQQQFSFLGTERVKGTKTNEQIFGINVFEYL